MIHCPNCGTALPDRARFCALCGTPLPPPAPQSSSSIKKTGKQKEKKNNGFFSAVLLGILKIFGVLALIAAILLGWALTINLVYGDQNKTDYALYLKDDSLYYRDFSKDASVKITSRLFSEGVPPYQYALSLLSGRITLNADHTRIFYPTKLDDDFQEGYTLCCQDITKKKSGEIKVDTDVTFYSTNLTGTEVLYLKGPSPIEPGTLYWSDLDSKEKLQSDVLWFYAKSTLKKVFYLTSDGDLYQWSKDIGAERIAKDVTQIPLVTEDLENLFYCDEDTLYQLTEGQEAPQEILSDVHDIVDLFYSEEQGLDVYYTQAETVEYLLTDLVEDDMAQIDPTLTKPYESDYRNPPAYPHSNAYATNEEYQAALEQYNQEYEIYLAGRQEAYAAYAEAMQLYSGKILRDALRKEMEGLSIRQTAYRLYHSDGSEETLLTESFRYHTDFYEDLFSSSSKDRAPLLVYAPYAPQSIRRPKLSELKNIDQVRDAAQSALLTTPEWHIAFGNEVTVLEDEAICGFVLSCDGSQLLCAKNYSDQNHTADIYLSTRDDSEFSQPVLYATGVHANLSSNTAAGYSYYFVDPHCSISRDNEILHFCYSRNESHMDAYYNGSLIAEDIDAIYRYWDDMCLYREVSRRGAGSLMLTKNNETFEIADNVHDALVAGEQDILYLQDYTEKHQSGDLYLYRNEASILLDDDVSALLSVPSSFCFLPRISLKALN